MQVTDFDVAVVGAGLSGLIVARSLARSGVSACVLESAARVGGRVQTVSGAEDTPVDLGGQWIGTEHSRMRSLAREFEMTLVPTHLSGRSLVWDRGKDVSRLPGTIIGAWVAKMRLRLLQSTGVGVNDLRTVEQWLRTVQPVGTRRLIENALSSLACVDSKDVSMLAFLDMFEGSSDISNMFTVGGGSEQWVLSDGAGTLAEALARDSSFRVELETTVDEVFRTKDGVNVQTNQGTVKARRVVIALAPPVSRRIAHVPELPVPRTRLEENTFMGVIYKVVVVYPTPFWRDRGLSGSLRILSEFMAEVADISPDGGPGRMTVLIPSASARALERLTPDVRQRTVLEQLAQVFGMEALTPLSFHEKSWHQDEHVLGGYNALPLVGAYEVMGTEGFKSVDRIHWAGTEAATMHTGYMEGAVLAGESAASEVMRHW